MIKVGAGSWFSNFKICLTGLLRPRIFEKLAALSILNRVLALFLIATFLTPIILFGPGHKVSGQTINPDQKSAPISAPPEPFAIASSYLPDPVISYLSEKTESIRAFFTVPPAPEGFDIIKPKAGSEVLFSALASSFGSFLGLSDSSSNPPSGENNLVFTLPVGTVRFDFDGDGHADIGRWHASNTEWKVKNSSNGNLTTTTIGSSSSVITPGDFDGDHTTDVAVFNAGTWTIKKSSNNTTYTTSFGSGGDKPVVGDYDADGKSDIAVFRPSNSTWYIFKSSNGTVITNAFGTSGDIPVPGNYDGDDQADMAFFRPSTGYWHIQGSSAGY